MLTLLYMVLLLAGAVGFLLHLYAQYRFARHMRTHYPRQWAIIAEPEQGKRSGIRTYARLQHVLRSPAPGLFEDRQLDRWHRIWKRAPFVAWPCWIGVLVIQALRHY